MKHRSTEKTMTLLIACGLLSLVSAPSAYAEEMMVVVPAEEGTPLLPRTTDWVTPIMTDLPVPMEESVFIVLDEPSYSPETYRLPSGKAVSLGRLESRFEIGKWALSPFMEHRASFSIEAHGSLQAYLAETPVLEVPRLLTREEQISKGMEFAETVTETVRSLPIPFVGSILGSVLRIGKDVDRTNKRLQEKYNLHFNYKDSTYLASYKNTF